MPGAKTPPIRRKKYKTVIPRSLKASPTKRQTSRTLLSPLKVSLALRKENHAETELSSAAESEDIDDSSATILSAKSVEENADLHDTASASSTSDDDNEKPSNIPSHVTLNNANDENSGKRSARGADAAPLPLLNIRKKKSTTMTARPRSTTERVEADRPRGRPQASGFKRKRLKPLKRISKQQKQSSSSDSEFESASVILKRQQTMPRVDRLMQQYRKGDIEKDDEEYSLSSSSSSSEADSVLEEILSHKNRRRRRSSKEASSQLRHRNVHSRRSRSSEQYTSSNCIPGHASYRPMFVQDGTGRKTIHSYGLKYSMEIFKREAIAAAETIREAVIDEWDKRNNRNFAVWRDKHVSKVAGSVRQRLRSTAVPSKYVRAHDWGLDSMAEINRQRAMDIKQTSQLLSKLQQQRAHLQTQLALETSRKMELERLYNELEHVDRDRVHPILVHHQQRQKRLAVKDEVKQAARSFCTAPPGTMARLCATVSKQRGDVRNATSASEMS